jgi:predicted MFS family arabinose efflux permease
MSLSASPRPVALRKNRDFMLLWSGQAVSELGSRAAWLAYPLLVLELTHSPAKAGVVTFVNRFPFFLFSLPAGALVDRWNRKRIMLVCDAGRLVGAASIALALLLGRASFVQVVVVAAIEGTLTVFVGPAEFAALRRIVAREQIAAAIAQNEARIYAGTLAGPPLGGLLYGLSRALPFVADAVSYAVSFLTLLRIRTTFQEPAGQARSRLHLDVAEGIRWLWRQSFLRTTFLLAGAGNFVSNALGLIVVVLATDNGASSTTIGLIFLLCGVGGLLGAAAAAPLTRRLSPTQVRVSYHLIYALLIPFLAVGSPLLIGVLFAVMLFGAPTLNAAFGSYQGALVPDHLQGRIESIAGLIAAGVAPLGPLLAGFLLGAVGGTETIFIFWAVSIAVVLVAGLSKALRQMPSLSELVPSR